jgi:hypothetical protein
MFIWFSPSAPALQAGGWWYTVIPWRRDLGAWYRRRWRWIFRSLLVPAKDKTKEAYHY